MGVPHAKKRRQNMKTPGKKFKPNNKRGPFPPNGWFGPPAMMDRPYGSGPFHGMMGGPRYMRLPPPPPPLMFRGRMGPPAPPGYLMGMRRPPRPHGPPMRPLLPPHAMRCPPPHMMRPFPPMARPFPSPMRKAVRQGKKRAKRPGEAASAGDISFLNDMSEPWITDDIRAENLKKQQMNKAARESRSDDAWAQFKAQRDKCHGLVRAARSQHLAKQPALAAPFQINPDPDCKGLDFTEDTLL